MFQSMTCSKCRGRFPTLDAHPVAVRRPRPKPAATEGVPLPPLEVLMVGGLNDLPTGPARREPRECCDRWEVQCDRCSEGATYWIPLGEVGLEAVDWLLHLHGKAWFDPRDLFDGLARGAGIPTYAEDE